MQGAGASLRDEVADGRPLWPGSSMSTDVVARWAACRSSCPSWTPPPARCAARRWRPLRCPRRTRGRSRAGSRPSRTRRGCGMLSLMMANEDLEACTCDLTAALGLSQPTVSHHMKKLSRRGAGVRAPQRGSVDLLPGRAGRAGGAGERHRPARLDFGRVPPSSRAAVPCRRDRRGLLVAGAAGRDVPQVPHRRRRGGSEDLRPDPRRHLPRLRPADPAAVSRSARWNVRTTAAGLACSVPPFATLAFEVWAQRTGRLAERRTPEPVAVTAQRLAPRRPDDPARAPPGVPAGGARGGDCWHEQTPEPRCLGARRRGGPHDVPGRRARSGEDRRSLATAATSPRAPTSPRPPTGTARRA